MTIKRTYRDELEKLDDAIDESILAASSDELREELAALGLDPDALVAEMDAVTGRARIAGAKRGLEQAKRAVLAFKARPADVSSDDRDAVRRKLGEMRAGDGAKASDMMMAARKGKGLSDSDKQGILDDLARLARLEAEDPGRMTALTHAERILKSLGIEAPGEIDLEAIAWTRSAVVDYRPLDRCEATIVGSKKKAVIAVNSRSPLERRRFSLAHELGHWHHHKAGCSSAVDGTSATSRTVRSIRSGRPTRSRLISFCRIICLVPDCARLSVRRLRLRGRSPRSIRRA